MSTARREYFLLIVGLILLIVTGASVYYIQRAPNRSRDIAQVTQLVTTFGASQKSISPVGPATSTSHDIQSGYGPLVTSQLLEQWEADPAHAPGRLTSSPWPERIVIDSISPQGAGYSVSGHTIMTSETGESSQVPVVMLVVRENAEWKIAVYQEATPL